MVTKWSYLCPSVRDSNAQRTKKHAKSLWHKQTNNVLLVWTWACGGLMWFQWKRVQFELKRTLTSHKHNKDWNKSSSGIETYQPNFSLQTEVPWDVAVLQHESIKWRAGAALPSMLEKLEHRLCVCVCVCRVLKGGLHQDNMALNSQPPEHHGGLVSALRWSQFGIIFGSQHMKVWDNLKLDYSTELGPG